MTVEESITDPDIRPCGGVPQLALTHPTLETLDVEEEAQGLYDHGCSLPQGMTTAGAQLLTTH